MSSFTVFHFAQLETSAKTGTRLCCRFFISFELFYEVWATTGQTDSRVDGNTGYRSACLSVCHIWTRA